MTEKDVKPIPKYILRMIEREDKKEYPLPSKQLRFYAYLTKYRGELVKVTVAVKHYRKKLYCKAVAWHGVHSPVCFVKDLEYCYCGSMGFRVGWYSEGIQKERRWYERGVCWAKDRYYDPWAVLVNPSFVEKFPEYKYSAYRLYHGDKLLKYLRLYELYPQLEMLMKSGLGMYYDSITILKRIGTDKAFCKWLIRNKQELTALPFPLYIETVMQAYKTGQSCKEIQVFLSRKKCFEREMDYKPIRRLFRGQKLKEFFRYIDEQKITPRLYLDYLKACEHLQLDMSLPQNRLPHDFMRWHDIRIDQYATAQAKRARKQNVTLKRHSAKSRKSILSYSTISAARSSALSQRHPPTLCARESFCTIAWGV